MNPNILSIECVIRFFLFSELEFEAIVAVDDKDDDDDDAYCGEIEVVKLNGDDD